MKRTPKTQVCRGPCGKRKGAEHFSPDARSRSGLNYMCRTCATARRNKWRHENPEKQRAAWNKHNRKRIGTVAYKEKSRAHDILGRAIKSGKVIRASRCSVCRRDQTRIIGHHADYSKPLDVMWLCGSCHWAEHKRIDSEARSAS